jgi:hypothetical protein
MPGWESIHSDHQDEYESLDITQDERAKMEDDRMIAGTGKYMKCLNVDVAQPQVPPLKVTLPLECP